MRHAGLLGATILLLFSVLSLPTLATPTTGKLLPLAQVRFTQDNDIKCLLQAKESGDQGTGPSTWILKMPAGCLIPRHHHTAEEQMIVVQGQVRTSMSGMNATLRPGGFALMPRGVAHEILCERACVVFVSFSAKYDIFWDK